MESFKELDEGKTPGPMVEIEFWDSRHKNMESLHEQLCRKSTKNLVSILKHTKSSYFPMFRLGFLSDSFYRLYVIDYFTEIYTDM